jgi:hypothetical protein
MSDSLVNVINGTVGKKDIYESIAAVMADIGAVGKNSKNSQQGFMFRGIDAVMNALSPALIKNKMFVVPRIISQERDERTNTKGTTLFYVRCTIEYTFYAEDGSHLEAVVIGEGMDAGDKATNKAMSIAFKYACFQVFCIPTEEMVDPDAECHEVKPKEKKAEPKAEPKTGKTEPQVDENALINAVQLKALKSRAEKDNVKEEVLKNLYKVDDLKNLTLKMYTNINDFWDRVVEIANK